MAAAVGQAAPPGLAVQGPALAAEVPPGPAGRLGGRGAGLRLLQEPVREDESGARLGGGGGPVGVLDPPVVLDGVALLEGAEPVVRAPAEHEALVVPLEEVLAAAADQHRREGVPQAAPVGLLGVGQGQEQVHLRPLGLAAQGDDHLVQAPEEEVDLGAQQRLAAPLGGGPQHQVRQQFGRRPLPLGQPAGGDPLGDDPGRLIELERAAEHLGGLVDVLVVDEVVVERLPPRVAGVVDLARQLLDDRLDRAQVDRLVQRLQQPTEPLHAVAPGGDGAEPLPGPLALDVRLADDGDLGRVDPEEPGGEPAGRVVLGAQGGLLAVGQGGRGADADDLVGRLAGQHAEAADQAGDLGPDRAGVGVGLVEDEVLERGLGEERDLGGAGGEDLQLAVVGQQDPRPAFLDLLLGEALLLGGERPDGPVLGLGLLPESVALGQVGVAGRAVEPLDLDLRGPVRGGPRPEAEADAGAAEHVPQAVELVVGQGVHRVDDDRRDARGDAPLALADQVVHDRVEERFGLAAARAGGHQDVPALPDGLEDLLLVLPHRRVADQPRHDVVEQAPVGQRLDRLPPGEGVGERDVRAPDQRDVQRRGAVEELAGLRFEVGIGEGEGREEVALELLADGVGEVDGVDRHGLNPRRRPARPAAILGFVRFVGRCRSRLIPGRRSPAPGDAATRAGDGRSCRVLSR